jgi:hypothetical protein
VHAHLVFDVLGGTNVSGDADLLEHVAQRDKVFDVLVGADRKKKKHVPESWSQFRKTAILTTCIRKVGQLYHQAHLRASSTTNKFHYKLIKSRKRHTNST